MLLPRTLYIWSQMARVYGPRLTLPCLPEHPTYAPDFVHPTLKEPATTENLAQFEPLLAN